MSERKPLRPTASANISHQGTNPVDTRADIRKRNIAEIYNVELSEKKASRRVLSNTPESVARSHYSDYEL